ncbi:TonB family protein [Mesorhizobium sp. M00.F.Ca.ET.186.01.1.1]|nr:TonB family protein [bacterium M00.F.Ca.ET.205.01.1.1]TGU53129.1 TonB family protein [bacterium M00.F.Ca.ET.152.01.1.1]TGV36095.1 TonB family protein [Mesorhizobium sp. M00.F.Ca.ET.186.01.1.1]TGZ43682.1 TonB family protein [bacterium M00.F.Ca.ET.162.01.1.1]
MGLEPAFSQDTVAWPPAGPFVLSLEPDDPDFVIPLGSLRSSLRDTPEKYTIADASGELTAIPAEPLGVTRTREPRHKWKAAVIFSCLLHAAAALAFLAIGDEAVQIEGADQDGIMLLGNAPEDQSAAGDVAEAAPESTKVTLVTMLDAKPVETLDAQPVTAMETTRPADIVGAQASATTTDPLPEILTIDPLQPDEDDNSVPKPAIQSTTTVEASTAMSERTTPVETSETVPAEPEPQPAQEKLQQAKAGKAKPAKPKKPEPEKRPVRKAQKAEPPKKAEKAPEKPGKAKPKAKAGSGGQNEADARRGVADGQTEGGTASRSQGGKSAVGNASASNYPGKVAARLRRASRGISSSARAKARNDVQVSFTIDANGGVGGVRIARSSGSPELDEAALAIIRRAAPFPPIPADTGRSSWSFSLPLGLAR